MTGELMTADEVAKRLRVPRSWVYLAAREGDMPSVRCGRYRRFDGRDVDDWISEQKQRPSRSGASSPADGATRTHALKRAAQ